jgi:hypothetical protein
MFAEQSGDTYKYILWTNSKPFENPMVHVATIVLEMVKSLVEVTADSENSILLYS